MRGDSMKRLVICFTTVWLVALLRLTVFRPGCFPTACFPDGWSGRPLLIIGS